MLSVVWFRIGRMTSTLTGDTLAGLVAEFAKLVDRLQQVDLVPASDDDLVGFWRSVEVQTRRLASVDQRVIACVEQRGLPGCVPTLPPRRWCEMC